jgi:hypothetical protein
MGNIIFVECSENNVTYLNALCKEKLVDTNYGILLKAVGQF